MPARETNRGMMEVPKWWMPLEEHGLEWVHPPASLAHPFDDGSMTMLERSVVETGKRLGPDAEVYRNGKMDS